MNSRAVKSTASETGTRTYESPLRRQQADQTRELILSAFAEQVADHGVRDFSIARVARRAGVSTRTVYHHFPDRDALLDALDEWFDGQIGGSEGPQLRKPTDLALVIEWLFPALDRHEAFVRALLVTGTGRRVRSRGRARRLGEIHDLMRRTTDRLEPSEGRRMTAVLAHLASSETWRAMKDESGLDGSEAGKAVGWAIRTLVADLERRNRKGGREGGGPGRGDGRGRR